MPLALSYRLLLKAAHEEKFRVLADVRDLQPQHSYIATDLLPNTKYEAHVETYSIPVVFPGSGSLSQPVSCVTVEGAPSEPPTNLEAATLGFDHVEVRWTPPRVSAGQVIGYRLFYDVAETESYAEVEVPASVTSYTATLLDPDTTYRFQVLAFTAAGEGPISDTLVCQTLESAKSRMTRLTTGEAVASPSPSPSKPVSRRSSVRAPSAEAESPINDEVATAQDDWQQLRHTGAHRKARPLIESWVKDDTAWHEARPDRPQPRELSESRPGGAIRGYEPQRVITGTQDRRPKIKSTWVAVDDDDREVVLSPAGKKVPLRNTTMEDRFLEQLKSGPVDFDPPRSQKPSDGGDSAPSSAIDQSETKKKGRGNWIANPSKPAEPTSVEPPSKLERQTSARVKTAAELTGEAMLVAIEGNIRVRGEIRGKRNAVRAKLEVMTERTRPVDEKATWLKGLFETENNAGALVMYTTSNTVIRETYSVCNEILKLFDLLRLKISKKDVYLDPGVTAELQERAPGATVPIVFASGVLLGNAKKILELNETGELKRLLKGYTEASPADCGGCGGRGYVVCTWCQGSLKSRSISTGPRSKAELRCTVCNENGLQRCPLC